MGGQEALRSTNITILTIIFIFMMVEVVVVDL
jgi:hypothetical protein